MAGSLSTAILSLFKIILPSISGISVRLGKDMTVLRKVMLSLVLMALVTALAPLFLKFALLDTQADKFVKGFVSGYAPENKD